MTVYRTVHIVDDEAAVRQSLARLFRTAGFAPLSYGSAQAFLAAATSLAAGCILLDVRMPAMDGLELQLRLNDLGVGLPLIVITGHADVAIAVQAMKAGAVDFIQKPYEDDVLLGAVEVALSRGAGSVQDREMQRAASLVTRLSRREREVLDGLVAGRPSKVIAFHLGISVRTVEVHRARMMDRLGVRRLAEAVRLAVMARLQS